MRRGSKKIRRKGRGSCRGERKKQEQEGSEKEQEEGLAEGKMMRWRRGRRKTRRRGKAVVEGE